MNISYDEAAGIFRLDAGGMTYVLRVTDEEGFPGHLYFGKRVGEDDISYLARTEEMPWLPSGNVRDRCSFLDSFPQEYPGNGVGDFRSPAVCVTDEKGQTGVQPLYVSHQIEQGKKTLPGLPSTFGTQKDSMTLSLLLADRETGLELTLCYTVFEGIPAVVRSVRAHNRGEKTIAIRRLMSCSLDMDVQDLRLLTLNGTWGREKHKQILPVGIGTQQVSSIRGISSHQAHPFLGLMAEHAGQESGEVYGFNLIYSGNFLAQTERDQFDRVRVQLGIHPKDFCWELAPGESFQSPEAVLVYSAEGIDGMTHAFHELFRNHLLRSPWLYRERPVLINNWEATFFDFDLEKLLTIARRAAKEGIELLVMDDGWFGRRKDDNSSLGDWTVNEEKLPGGIARLSEELAKLNMKLGIWFEPEMVSPDSDLYRAHPDWAFSFDGRTPCRARNQYVLDLTRREVRDAVFDQIAAVLDSGEVAYVKWDMNRPLTDVASHAEGGQSGALFHRFVLGTYELQERLITRYPELLLENCSSGGGRFDAGMLYYSPQIWTSDNTDAIERLAIQEGTAMLYPMSTMGAHISVSPSQAVGRLVPMATRGHVALAGTFGYELDINHLPEEDAALISGQIALYHRYGDLVREGDYHRLASWQDNRLFDCYEVISKDKQLALVTFVQVMGEANVKSRRIRIPHLSPDARYRVTVVDPAVREHDQSGNFIGSDEIACMRSILDKPITGRTLAEAGILMPKLRGDFRSVLIEFRQEG
ncbi:MAG: alpha-galactosidase [Lachnospiraceae bacterium]|nr:alpha-galactosidase [Lachnospiraceae bacterium]